MSATPYRVVALLCSAASRPRWPAACPTLGRQLHALFPEVQQPDRGSRADLQLPPNSSLEYDRGGLKHPIEGTAIGRLVWAMVGGYTQRQQLHLGAAAIYEALVEVRDDPQLLQAFALDPAKLLHRLHLSWLHLWLLVGHFKGQGDPAVKRWRDYLYTDYFYKDMDRSIRAEVQVHPSKWVKQVEKVMFSSGLAYDMALEGRRPDLVPGQAEIKDWLPGDPETAFVDALVRNVYDGRAQEHWQDARRLATYLRWQQSNLQLTPDEALLRGQVSFLQPLLGASNPQQQQQQAEGTVTS